MAIKRKDCHPPKSDGRPLWGANTPQYVHYEALGYFVRGGGIATPEVWRTQNGGLQIPNRFRCWGFVRAKGLPESLRSRDKLLALLGTKKPGSRQVYFCAGEGTRTPTPHGTRS